MEVIYDLRRIIKRRDYIKLMLKYYRGESLSGGGYDRL